MEAQNNFSNSQVQIEKEESSSLDFQTIYTMLILNWKWFVLSVILCLGCGIIYLRYKTPMYQAQAKLLIKDDDSNNRGSSKSALLNATNLGIMTNSTGIDNEMEILTSLSIAQQAVRDLKLYTTYKAKGKIKDHLLYKTEPIFVDLDPGHLEKLVYPITLSIKRDGNLYKVAGKCTVSAFEETEKAEYPIEKVLNGIPARIFTRVGTITLNPNMQVAAMPDGSTLKVSIVAPKYAAAKYVAALSVSPTSKTTTIAQMVLTDEVPQRAVDYLRQLTVCYNRQANEDKNEITVRT